MKVSKSHNIRTLMMVLWVGLLSSGFLGCANVQHQAKFNQNYLPKEDVSIKVRKIANDTGVTFDIDIEKKLADALEDQLLEEDLLWLGDKEPSLFMEARIVGYKKGSAFKRWMMPGWGATQLSIRCELKDGKDSVVGSAVASREVVAGGLYSVGAWQTVFKDVASDVAEDLRDQIESQGYIVEKKTLPKEATEQPIAAFSPATVDPTEPWTGVWAVDGGRLMGGIWGMKQSGSIVKSTGDSYYDFKGKVRGNRLEGKIKGDYDEYRNFVIKMSSDGLTFQGKSGTHQLKGKRKTNKMAAATPVTFNINEPWSGVWRVEGSRLVNGIWAMKQSGKIVKSTNDSYYEFKGKISGNQLKGRVVGDYNISNKFVFDISSDGQSFKGTITSDWQNRAKQIKGTRE